MLKYFGMAMICRLPKLNSDTAEVPRYRYAGLILNYNTESLSTIPECNSLATAATSIGLHAEEDRTLGIMASCIHNSDVLYYQGMGIQ